MLKKLLRSRLTIIVMALCVGMMPFKAAFAADPMLSDKHGAKGVACAQCHKETPPAKAVKAAQCETCHGNNDAMAKVTDKINPNPHFTHMGNLDCTECHRGHTPSVVMCDECHKFKLKAP